MSTINYIRVCRSLKVEELKYNVEEQQNYTKKKSEETVQRERLDNKYNSRRNVCENCFTVKPLSGICTNC